MCGAGDQQNESRWGDWGRVAAGHCEEASKPWGERGRAAKESLDHTHSALARWPARTHPRFMEHRQRAAGQTRRRGVGERFPTRRPPRSEQGDFCRPPSRCSTKIECALSGRGRRPPPRPSDLGHGLGIVTGASAVHGSVLAERIGANVVLHERVESHGSPLLVANGPWLEPLRLAERCTAGGDAGNPHQGQQGCPRRKRSRDGHGRDSGAGEGA